MDYQWRTERLREFEEKLGMPENALHHPDHGWAYYTWYPWSKSVHGFWRVDDDVHNLDVWTLDWDRCGRDGLYASWCPSSSRPPYLRLVAVVDENTVSRGVYEYFMTRFWETLIADPDAFGPHLGEELVHVGYARRERRHQ